MKTKFGIVGCGFLGNIVADAWEKGLLEDYEPVAVWYAKAAMDGCGKPQPKTKRSLCRRRHEKVQR